MSVVEAVKTIRPRRAVELMPEYHPPLAARESLRLDFNENTFEPSPKVLEVLHALTAASLTKYPEREHAEHLVAAHLGLEPEQVLLANGVDEAIHTICVTFLEQDDEALVWTPSFFMYDVSIGLMAPGGLRTVQSGPSLTFPLERFLAAITARTKLIFIATPNNPTGAVVSQAQLLKVAEAAPHAVLMVDEAYFHFFGESMLDHVGKLPNLLVTRTFSKAYGMANLRVGMIAGDVALMQSLRKASSPYNVNGVALACLPAALADEAYLNWYANEVKSGRDRMMAALDALGVPYFPSQANFLLMNIGAKHHELVAAARERGVLLRDRSTDPGCDGYVRITIGIADHVTTAIAVMGEALRAIGWTRPEPAHDGPLSKNVGEREYE